MSSRKHEVPDELLSSLLANYKKPEDLIGENGLLKQLTKLLVERALDAEMAEHLGHDKHEPVANAAGNTRNGRSRKTLKGEFGELPIEIPRDRHGSFEPQLIPKHQTRWVGFDDKILSLYARGMTVREIQAHLEEMYGAEVSPSLISSVTDAVVDEVKAWQVRPLDPVYPIVYLDCIHVKVREGAVRIKAVYLAIGVTMAGEKEVLGLWLAQTEGAKFWLQVVTELRNRGVQDIFIACVDGLKGFPEAIEAVFPHTTVQLCIVHMVRHSLNYVSWKRRAEVAADLKRIYACATVEEAEQRLAEFEAKWDTEYPPIGQSWRRDSASRCSFEDCRKCSSASRACVCFCSSDWMWASWSARRASSPAPRSSSVRTAMMRSCSCPIASWCKRVSSCSAVSVRCRRSLKARPSRSCAASASAAF